MMSKFKYLIDGILSNKEMFVMVIAFAVTVILVYIIRRMNIDHAWTIAIIVGGLADILILLIGDLMYTTNISIIGIILGSVVAFAVVKVLQFFVFNVDYARTERVQFEDDEYYYFVKAVPKVTISTPEVKVKKVSGKSSEAKNANERSRERTASTAGNAGVQSAAREAVARTSAAQGTVRNGATSTRTAGTASRTAGTIPQGTRTVPSGTMSQGTAGVQRTSVRPGTTPTSGARRTYTSDDNK